MGWYFPLPLDTGVLHRHVGIEALGNRVADEGGALFLEQLDQPLLLCHEGVDPGGLAVEKSGDTARCSERGGRAKNSSSNRITCKAQSA